MSGDAVRRAVRTFVIAFFGLFIPGALGFLNDVTAWATSGGQRPFPDMHSVAFLGVAALAAGLIAIFNLLWNWIEDMTGKGLLRTPQTRTQPGPPAG